MEHEKFADSIPRYGKTKRISHHNFDETFENIKEIHASLCKKDPDIVKLMIQLMIRGALSTGHDGES